MVEERRKEVRDGEPILKREREGQREPEKDQKMKRQ